MILLFHNLGTGNPTEDLILVLTAIGGWIISTILIFRGIYRFVKSEQKSKLLVTTFLLFAIWRLCLFIFSIPSEIFDPSALFTFPFGFFAGIPFLFVFDTRDLFVYEILLFVGSIANGIAIINFANFLTKRIDSALK